MKWILWREYRLNRLILITGAVLLFLPYLFLFIALAWPQGTSPSVLDGFAGAVVYSLVLSHLTIVLLGGNAFAGERADRSAEFMAYLPLPRKRLLCSKLIIAFSTVAIILGTNLFVLWLISCIEPGLWQIWNRPTVEYIAVILWLSCTSLTFYGVSWLISSLQSSPTFAVGGGLIAPLLVIAGLGAAAWKIGILNTDDRFIPAGYTIICLTLAIASFTIGTWHYLKRVEP